MTTTILLAERTGAPGKPSALGRRTGEIRVHDTKVFFCEDASPSGTFTIMFPVLCRVVNAMRRRGWKVGRDRDRHIPERISRYYWRGKHGTLEFAASVCGHTFEIGFFQSVTSSNPNGGRDQFDQLPKMTAISRALRLQCLVEMARVVRVGEATGYVISERNGFHQSRRPQPPTLLEIRDLAELGDHRGTPLEIFNRSWGADRFERDATGWPSSKELSCWGRHDRDGKAITQGETKYMRTASGRLVRGEVVGGINGNWQLISNGRSIALTHCAKDFFDCDRPDLEPRRVKDQRKHLIEELQKAVQDERYGRVAAIGRVLACRAQKPQPGSE